MAADATRAAHAEAVADVRSGRCWNSWSYSMARCRRGVDDRKHVNGHLWHTYGEIEGSGRAVELRSDPTHSTNDTTPRRACFTTGRQAMSSARIGVSDSARWALRFARTSIRPRSAWRAASCSSNQKVSDGSHVRSVV